MKQPRKFFTTTARAIFAVLWLGGAAFLVLNLYITSLKFLNPAGTILMMQRAAAGEDIKREWMPLSDVSPHIIRAVIAAEDGRFCSHKGIDWDAVNAARIHNEKPGARRRGGSTITQQTAKNVVLWNGGGMPRKAAEAWFASWIDYVWGKPRVMEVYLNIAEWGDGIFGIEAAAQARFGVSARALTPSQAAALAAVLPSPNKWRLNPPGPYVTQRTAVIQQRMSVVRNSGYDDCVNDHATTRRASKPKPTL